MNAYQLVQPRVTPNVFAEISDVLRTFTGEQTAVVDAWLNTRDNLIVESTAGSGKSTLLRVLATIAPRTPADKGRMAVFAFNASIADELKEKLPKDLVISTFHAFGLKLIRQHARREVKVIAFKKRNIVKAYLKGLGHELHTKAHVNGLMTLVEQFLIHLVQVDEASVVEMCAKNDLKFAPELDLVAAVQHVSKEALRQYEEEGLIDYLDMLYIPLKKGYGRGCMKWMLVDEAQDFSRLQHKLVRHLLAPEGRVVLVGDPAQAIYVFTGADSEGMNRAAKFFNATVLHLTYTFRCPKSHVEGYAVKFSEHIRTPEKGLDGNDWKLGEVINLTTQALRAELQGGDLVLARTNAPIIQLALALLRMGKDVHLLGLDLKKELGHYFEKAFPQPFTAADIEHRLMLTYDRLLEERYERGENGKTLERGAERDADMLASVGAVALRAASDRDGPTSLGDLQRVLDELLKGGKDAINLCTVHKSKGLEARRVAILNPETLLTPKNDEEKAVAFVAFSRSRDVLMLVSDDSAPVEDTDAELE
ncbi:UvrD-helicase domain-containing protein [Deinococcus antarcticus]|uniref:DNA 3'-5' helicase n=1 Tax=Deinococcus antarcticus TaxID=1298767 RepID=A0ABV8ACX5_9DEIO